MPLPLLLSNDDDDNDDQEDHEHPVQRLLRLALAHAHVMDFGRRWLHALFPVLAAAEPRATGPLLLGGGAGIAVSLCIRTVVGRPRRRGISATAPFYMYTTCTSQIHYILGLVDSVY